MGTRRGSAELRNRSRGRRSGGFSPAFEPTRLFDRAETLPAIKRSAVVPTRKPLINPLGQLRWPQSSLPFRVQILSLPSRRRPPAARPLSPPLPSRRAVQIINPCEIRNEYCVANSTLLSVHSARRLFFGFAGRSRATVLRRSSFIFLTPPCLDVYAPCKPPGRRLLSPAPLRRRL